MAPYIFAAIAILMSASARDVRPIVDASRVAHAAPDLVALAEVMPASAPSYVDAVVEAVADEGALFERDAGGLTADERTALALVAVAWNESHLADDVAQCSAPISRARPQDQGKSIGVTQLYEGYAWFGHEREEICDSVGLQFRLALRVLRAGRKACPGQGVLGAFTFFNAGMRTACRPTYQARRTYATFAALAAEAGRWPRPPVLAQN